MSKMSYETAKRIYDIYLSKVKEGNRILPSDAFRIYYSGIDISTDERKKELSDFGCMIEKAISAGKKGQEISDYFEERAIEEGEIKEPNLHDLFHDSLDDDYFGETNAPASIDELETYSSESVGFKR